ncbi:MAG: glycosyltransferase family 4 protein [Gemmatimonadota bacterium]
MSADRPRLLFLGQTLPYPPDSGVAIRTYNVLRLLAERYDVDALFFWRTRSTSDGPLVLARTAALGPLARVQAFPIPQEHSRLRFGFDNLVSLASGQPYTRYAYSSGRFLAALTRLLREKEYSLVHVDSLDLVRYLPLLPLDRTVCAHHNVESALLVRRSEWGPNTLARKVMRRQGRLVERAEARWCPRVRLNVAVSERDAEHFRTVAPGSNVCVVPNGVDVNAFQPREGRENGLVFVGGTSWFPNRDALSFFSRDVLPEVRRLRPNLGVSWVGRATPGEIELHAELGVQMTGYVEDVRPHVADAACVIVPVRVGGGTRLKILDAWAMGKAVVSTSVGCEGLEAIHGRNILVADEPAAFAEAAVRVSEDEELRMRLGVGARETAVERYAWSAIGEDMHEDYAKVAVSLNGELVGAGS